MALWEFSGYIPVFLIMGAFFAWLHFHPVWKGRKPVKDKLLRGPGESLQIKIEDLTEKYPLVVLFALGTALGNFTSIMMKHKGPLASQLLAGAWTVMLIGMGPVWSTDFSRFAVAWRLQTRFQRRASGR